MLYAIIESNSLHMMLPDPFLCVAVDRGWGMRLKDKGECKVFIFKEAV